MEEIPSLQCLLRMTTMRRKNSCLVILPRLVLSWLFCNGISHAADTLRAGEVIRDGEFLESLGGIFRLNFFSIDSSNGDYLGIQYMSYDDKVVWVANREIPLNHASGVLNMTQDGNLVITDNRGTSITINSEQPAPRSSSNTSATLLDSGNLVLRAGDRIVWQSFDYPSDTFLPGMKLGWFDLKTGRPHNRLLTSWLSPTLPAPGTFTFGVDPNITEELVIWQRGVLYWRSGIWNGYNFSYFPDIDVPDEGFDRFVDEFVKFNFSYFSNENESYFTYTVVNNFTWIEMNLLGQISLLVTLNGSKSIIASKIPCDYDKVKSWSKGCVTPEPPICRGRGVFSQIQGIMVEWDQYSANSSLGLSDCREICVRNCSCNAYATFLSNGIGCRFSQRQQPDSLDSEGYFFYIQNNSGVVLPHPQPPPPKTGNNSGVVLPHLPPPPPKTRNDSGVVLPHPQPPPPKTRNDTVVEKDHPWKRRLWLTVGGPVVSLIILTLVSILCCLRWRRCCFGGKNGNRQDGISRDTELLMYKAGTSLAAIDLLGGVHELELSGKKGHELLLFNFSSIEIATDYFSDANKLGQGGFGPVYKGKLVKGQEIAVKRLSRSSGQGLEEFKNEVVLISKLQHRNLVRLLGCCIQGEERILIYEYLPNNSLDSFLFDATKRALLDWKKRVCIIEGITQGLLYLHKYSRLKIIHRDLKTSNILLDSDMNPKISDFGTARIFGENESRANTNRIVGTYGYMSPEYAMDGLFSVKSDVFSFGVMMLEIISGKKNTGFYESNRSLNLLGYAWDLYREGRCLELMDPTVEETCSRNEVLRCVQVGLLCVQESAVDRPTMSDVMSMLSNESITLPSPKQPAFSTIVSVNDVDLLENPRPYSINNVTISEIEAR